MMELKINVNNHSQNEPYTNLIISMLKQRFSNTEGVSNIDVEINENIDSRVPWLL